MKCAICNSVMILRHDVQTHTNIMWCGCGYQESISCEAIADTAAMDQWLKAQPTDGLYAPV